jgi:hypothetical protein
VAQRAADDGAGPHTAAYPCSVEDLEIAGFPQVTCGFSWWGGWGSNPRPAHYKNSGPVLRMRYLHRYHGVMPPMALITPFAQVPRSTSRSTTTTVSACCQLRSVAEALLRTCRGGRQRGLPVYDALPVSGAGSKSLR